MVYMKIDKVILSSNDSKKYLEFWPIVSSAWKNIGIEPVLIYTGGKKFKFSKNDNIINFNLKKINSAFVAQNVRLLAPSLFPNDIVIISDIDNMPLSRDYFQNNIDKFSDDNFVVYRPGAASKDMVSIMWNAALGSTWSEIFEISNISDMESKIYSWYPKKYKIEGENWYFDQRMLKKHIMDFEKNFSNRLIKLNDETSGFLRLNRSNLKKNETFFNPKIKYSDFHMPRPYSKNKDLINSVYDTIFST